MWDSHAYTDSIPHFNSNGNGDADSDTDSDTDTGTGPLAVDDLVRLSSGSEADPASLDHIVFELTRSLLGIQGSDDAADPG